MAKVYEFLAEGFEDVEALGVVDVLRRGGVDIKTVSMTESKSVTSAHGIKVEADLMFADCDFDSADMLLLPGGMPGSTNLRGHQGLGKLLLSHYEKGKRLGAICAAPMVFGQLGILKGRKATCYPGFEKFLDGAEYTAALVQEDGNIITGKGPAATFEYAATILAYYRGEQAAKDILKGMMFS